MVETDLLVCDCKRLSKTAENHGQEAFFFFDLKKGKVNGKMSCKKK